MKYPGGLLFSAVRVGARLPKGHTDWKSGTRAELVTEIREDCDLPAPTSIRRPSTRMGRPTLRQVKQSP